MSSEESGCFLKICQKLMREVMEKTKSNKKFVVNFALAYGGRQEITDAVKKLAEELKYGNLKADEIDEKAIASHLYLQNEPDLVIRPGEK